MTVTNTDADKVVDDNKEVTEDDLRDLKYGSEDVETSGEEDEAADANKGDDSSEEAGESDGQTDTDTEIGEEESDSDKPEFVKEFPNIKGDTPEEYAKNLEIAYNNSTAEFQRLRDQGTQDDKGEDKSTGKPEVDITNPLQLYAKQQMDKEITKAYADFSKKYSQVTDQVEYNRFTQTVAVLSSTILNSEKRLASPEELYAKSAVILGWQPNDVVDKSDKVAAAAKDGAAASKTSSGGKPAPKGKVTPAMIAANRKMYPGKSDAEIIKELEPYIT